MTAIIEQGDTVGEGSTDPQRRSVISWLLFIFMEIPTIVLIFLLMLHVVINALLRTFLNAPVQNTIETVEWIYMPLIALFGFVVAQQARQHIEAEVVSGYFPVVVRKWVQGVLYLMCAAMTVGFTIGGWNDAVHAFSINQRAGISDIVSGPVYFAVPLVFAIFTLQLLVQAFNTMRGTEGEEHALTDGSGLGIEVDTDFGKEDR